MNGAVAETTPQVGVNPDNKPAATLVSGLAALGTVLAAAGVTEGVVPRMVGEEGFWFGLAVAGTLLAGLCGVLAALFAKRKRRERYLLVASNVLLLLGLMSGLIGAILVWSSTRVPTLTATPETTARGTFLNVTVKDTGLDSREHLALLVEPLRVVRDPNAEAGTLLRPGRAIYSASLGSDENGKIDQSIKVRLPDGFQGYVGARAFTGGLPKGCYAKNRADGCISARLINVPERPQLKTRWDRRGKRLRVSLAAHQIFGQTLTLRVLGRRASKWREVAHWNLAPNAGGSFSHGYSVGMKRFRSACVVASTSAQKRCHPRAGDRRSVWVRYRVLR